jgi:spore germination protein YaaH
LERYDLDGIDVDIEGEAVTETYEPFVLRLAEALPEEKVLTAAVATKNGEAFSMTALEAYDFINIMAYDHCSWSDTPCDQASMTGARADLEYWTETRGYPRRKAVLGVPFYGWCWGCTEMQSSLTYPQIIRDYPDGRTKDWIEEGEVTITLNGPSTIREKALLAHDYGGIMIWELGQDAAGGDSLFAEIAGSQ